MKSKEIMSKYMSIYNDIEESNGILTEEQSQELFALDEAKEQKILAIAHVIRDKQKIKETLKAEIKRLEGKIDIIDNSIDYLHSLINTLNPEQDIKVNDNIISTFWKVSKSTIIDDESKIDNKYKTKKTTISVLKDAIKKDIESGVVVEGAHIEEKKNFNIRG